MKKIIGLDLGTNSIGWAVVEQAENETETSSIVRAGVRVNPLTTDEQTNFEKGKSITTTADRTLKRGMRRNHQRYKLRRESLKAVLKENGVLSADAVLSEQGPDSTYNTYKMRAKAATEEIALDDFARVLLMLNKKRGYKSNRKAKSEDEGALIDGMDVAKQLYEGHKTPGQFVLERLNADKKAIPDFYRSDLIAEFRQIWNKQREYYPALTDELLEEIIGKNEKATWAILSEKVQSLTGSFKLKRGELKPLYELRVKALTEQIDLEELVVVLQKINVQINGSSGYLGAIGDRSKELYFNRQTIGQYLWSLLEKDRHCRLKNRVFYRQDYLNEFEQLWETQAKYHPNLTNELKCKIRNAILFYQRPLKSQKGLISLCEFESKEMKVCVNGVEKTKLVGPRVCPKSSPLFQDFKVWQILNNLQYTLPHSRKKCFLDNEQKALLYKELAYTKALDSKDVLRLLFGREGALYKLNYRKVEGNRTVAALFEAFGNIAENSGHTNPNGKPAEEVIQTLHAIFEGLTFSTDILHFDSTPANGKVEDEPLFKLWHLLYSFEGDNSVSGNEKLINTLQQRYGFDVEYAHLLASLVFEDDYGSLSSKAIKKILPYLKEGLTYSDACEKAGYKHSKNSLTKEEIANKILKDHLEALPKNSLRNPVVEKILNQMVHVVNSLIDEYGKPDEVHIELARELKKSQAERQEMQKSIGEAEKINDETVKVLNGMGIANPSRNDVLRYKLWQELAGNGYKTLYSNREIPLEKLFSKEIEIEHIIPQAKLFDDSFSNKTLEYREVNLAKSNATAYDYVSNTYGPEGLQAYENRINDLFKRGVIRKSKYEKLLMSEADIPSGFINRDLRDTQYIAKKAKEMLNDVVRVVVSTTGSVTDRLREDWGLMDLMKDLNWDKYAVLNQVEYKEDKDGRRLRKIKDWTKRDDHRHHAMDAITIAFTKPSHIQYLNNLNARINKLGSTVAVVKLEDYELRSLSKEERSAVIYAIEQKELARDKNNRLRFNPPMPLNEFRAAARKALSDILVSIKAKNKVATRNTNKTKTKEGYNKKVELTPRGLLHKETVYGARKRYVTKEEKVGSGFDKAHIMMVANQREREALLKRLEEFGGDAKKAFTGKNALDKNPIYLDEAHRMQVPLKVKTVTTEVYYAVRKPITKDLNIDKVVDNKIKQLLEERIRAYGGDKNKAFANLEENPIWLNQAKGIAVKSVTVAENLGNAVALHDKKDKDGNLLLDVAGNHQPTDFVNPNNNHHAAIYRDADGKLQQNVVTFYEVMERKAQGLPIIDKTYNAEQGWQFLFSIKQNEYFVFPDAATGFNPNEIDLLNPDNYALISPHLFRVQKMSTGDYNFRHHLETTVNRDDKVLKGVAFLRLSLSYLEGIVKVRVNHIGQIVAVGEY